MNAENRVNILRRALENGSTIMRIMCMQKCTGKDKN